MRSAGIPSGLVGGVRAEDGGARIPESSATIVFDDAVEMLSGRLRVRAARSRSREAVAKRRRRELHSRWSRDTGSSDSPSRSRRRWGSMAVSGTFETRI